MKLVGFLFKNPETGKWESDGLRAIGDENTGRVELFKNIRSLHTIEDINDRISNFLGAVGKGKRFQVKITKRGWFHSQGTIFDSWDGSTKDVEIGNAVADIISKFHS